MPRPSVAAALVFSVLFLASSDLLAAPAPVKVEKAANAAASPRLKLSTERVVVFKDGHGLVVKNATATADGDGHVFTADVPDGAILGCFWAIGQDNKILAMRAEWDEKKETRQVKTPAVTVAELLRANLGKSVTIEQTDKSKEGTSYTTEGKLLELLELPADIAPPRDADPADVSATGAITYPISVREGVVTTGAFTAESIASGGTLIRELAPRNGEFVVIAQEGDRRNILPISHVQGVSGGKDFVTTVTRQQEVLSRTKRLSFDFGPDSAGKPVSLKLFYFTAGLRWIPTYRVSGELKDKADLALQGEIINDVTDIDHAALDLVVGVPNFRFKDVVSPLTLEQTLRQVTTLTLANTYNGNNLNISNGSFSNDLTSQVAGPARPAGGEGIAPELAGAVGEQDLFVYSMKDFSLKKHARATVALWQQTAHLRHLYTYDIHARRSRTGGSLLDDSNPGHSHSPLQIAINQVWHQLELTNNGTIPWTTGAALMLREALPLGQDLLTYTPPTGKALLPVTVAVDLRGTWEEQEIERKPNALHFDGYDHLLIKKKGTVTLTSYRKDKSDMRITVSTGGKVSVASDDGKIKLNDFRSSDWDEPSTVRVNNHSDVVWEFSIDPGATKTITYETSFFVR